jgi:hypothetical protein
MTVPKNHLREVSMTCSDAKEAWREFWVAHSQSLILAFISEDLRSDVAAWEEDLQERIGEAIVTAPILAEKDGDDSAPFQSYDRNSTTFFTQAYLEELEARLFPKFGPVKDNKWHILCLVVVGLHSAVEGYAKACGAFDGKNNMPTKVKEWLSSQGIVLTSKINKEVVLLDATRHAIIHQNGRVDDKYKKDAGSQLGIGERIPLTLWEVVAWADASWNFSSKIRAAADALQRRT